MSEAVSFYFIVFLLFLMHTLLVYTSEWERELPCSTRFSDLACEFISFPFL